MLRTVIKVFAIVLVAQSEAVKLTHNLDEGQSKYSDADIQNIMNLVHYNDGGMISKGDLISAFERLA